jgi:hypothetical protein
MAERRPNPKTVDRCRLSVELKTLRALIIAEKSKEEGERE